MLKKVFDLVLAFLLGIIFCVPILIVAGLVLLTSSGPILYWSKRVGKGQKIFLMPKFRTMQVNCPEVATHLLANPSTYLTPVGSFLRKTSLDELPQLWSIWAGDMSFVGPRPALFNQDDLIALRSEHGVDQLLPGITGWAQVNGRDELSVSNKVQYEIEYLKGRSIWFDIKILALTALKVVDGAGVSH